MTPTAWIARLVSGRSKKVREELEIALPLAPREPARLQDTQQQRRMSQGEQCEFARKAPFES